MALVTVTGETDMTGFLRFLSRISIRLLGFNILVVFLPVAGFLFLDTYEKQLLKAQEDSMVQQGRLLAAALSERDNFRYEVAEEILIHLQKRTDARLRVVSRDGTLLADSSIVGSDEEIAMAENEDIESLENEVSADDTSDQDDLLYNIATWPFRLYRRFFQPPLPVVEDPQYYASNKPILGPEVQAALEGTYKAVWRISAGGQRSVTLYSGLPVWNKGRVVAAVLVSQSTYKILRNLYEVRLDIFKISLGSIIVAVVLSFILSATIAQPLKRLRNEAEAILDRRGRLTRLFTHSKRMDEIGDLARSLEELTRRLEKHLSFIESFASDLSHEFKNPLASIRSAIDIALEADNKKEREYFLRMVMRDVGRMERLLTGAREISRIDTSLEAEECKEFDVSTLLSYIIEGFRLRTGKVVFELDLPVHPVLLYASPERLSQVFENLLDNAVSFSPENGHIRINLKQNDSQAFISICDEGPGIPEENISRIFNRFFSFRPGEGKKVEHTGLGLSLAKAIVEGYGGSISAKNSDHIGVIFTVVLPLKQERPK
jgi:two-component system sensor histidine kinase ChvG